MKDENSQQINDFAEVLTGNENGPKVELQLSLNDVDALLESITFILASVSRQTEVNEFYQVMKPLADKYAVVQWKLEQFQKQLKQMNNVTEQG